MTFAKEAWPFVIPVLILGGGAWTLGWPRSAVACLLLAAALLFFFRVPRRSTEGLAADAVLAPANGKVLRVESVDDPEFATGSYRRIVIFLSVFNVHVQRAPLSGKVVLSRYRKGKKLAAFDKRAGELNESHLTVLETESGERIGVRQIAGLVARRVVADLEPGDVVRRGDRIGLIKFGSRVDLYLPDNFRLQVQPGQRVHEGLTVVARSAKDQ